MKQFLLLLTLLSTPMAFAVPTPTLKAPDVLTSEVQEVKPSAEGTVVVFLSASCPCSNSHVAELKSLAQEFPQFAFVGVHSNVDEEATATKEYFQKVKMGFPVLQDDNAKIADEFKALKTPHAFILSKDGKVLYQGGVSSSRDITKADRKYLREALNDLKEHHAVKTPEGRTLGCTISRGEKNVW
jgi:thioredoxin-related protein